MAAPIIQIGNRTYIRERKSKAFKIPVDELADVRAQEIPAGSQLEVVGIPCPLKGSSRLVIKNTSENPWDPKLHIFVTLSTTLRSESEVASLKSRLSLTAPDEGFGPFSFRSVRLKEESALAYIFENELVAKDGAPIGLLIAPILAEMSRITLAANQLAIGLAELSDHHELVSWLSAQPRQLTVLLVARAALREVPALRDIFAVGTFRVAEALASEVLLPAFRALAVTWVLGTIPNLEEGVTPAASDAEGAAYDAGRFTASNRYNEKKMRRIQHVAGVAQSAANTAIAKDPASIAANSIEHIFLDKDNGFDLFGEAFLIDVSEIRKNRTLLERPLWLLPMPGQVRQDWTYLRDGLLTLNDDWRAWTEWYEARLNGEQTSDALEVARVSITRDSWDQGPRVVNKQIMALMGRNTADEDIAQGPGPYTFATQDGKLVARAVFGEPAIDYQIAEDMRDALREIISVSLRSLTENYADPSLTDALGRVFQDLDSKVEKPRLGRLLVDLRVMRGFSNVYMAAERGHELGISGQVVAITESLADFISLYGIVKDIEARRVALGVVAESDMAAFSGAMQSIVGSATVSTFVGSSAISALTEGDTEIAALSTKINNFSINIDDRAAAIKARGELIGQKSLTIWNYTARVLSEAGKAVGVGAKDGLQEASKRIVGGTLKGGAIWLAAHFADPTMTMSLILESFRPLAKKAEEVKSAVEQATEDDDEND